ncbi:MAG: type II toxin-antitoxin system HigB family toxin [Bacteroidetes bacterium]|nr:type II toxin-antitoxin system HigB family toxin [Bacteroidota bacterium]
MVIISKARLIEFYNDQPKAKEPLLSWYNLAQESDWSNFSEVKATFNSVDSVGNRRFVFNIGGNKYRLVVLIFFNVRTIYIRFVGTHKEYDKIENIKKV